MSHGVLSRGILYSLGIVINRVVPERWFRFRIFRVYQLQSPGEDCQAAVQPPLQFQWCDSHEEDQRAVQVTGFHGGKDLCPAGYEACLVLDQGQPIAGIWKAESAFDERELGLRVVLADDQAWLFAARVAPGNRRRGVYRRLLRHVLSSDSSRTHLASINPTNRASTAAHRQFLRSTIGTCVSFRFFSVAVSLAGGGLSLDHYLSFRCHQQPLQLRIGVTESSPSKSP